MQRRGLFEALCFTDLDGALFQPKWANAAGFHPMVETPTGDVIGWATAEQAELWDEIRYQAFCVGVTSRSAEQVAQVTGWDPLHDHQLILADHGLTLLYRNYRKSRAWEVIKPWSTSYLEIARAHAKQLQADGAALCFSAMQALPELAKFNARMVFPRSAAGSVEPIYAAMQAPALLRHALERKEPELFLKLRAFVQDFVIGLGGRYHYHETESSLALIPAEWSRAAVVERLTAMIMQGDALGDERLGLALADIGRPKTLLAARQPSIAGVVL